MNLFRSIRNFFRRGGGKMTLAPQRVFEADIRSVMYSSGPTGPKADEARQTVTGAPYLRPGYRVLEETVPVKSSHSPDEAWNNTVLPVLAGMAAANLIDRDPAPAPSTDVPLEAPSPAPSSYDSMPSSYDSGGSSCDSGGSSCGGGCE